MPAIFFSASDILSMPSLSICSEPIICTGAVVLTLLVSWTDTTSTPAIRCVLPAIVSPRSCVHTLKGNRHNNPMRMYFILLASFSLERNIVRTLQFLHAVSPVVVARNTKRSDGKPSGTTGRSSDFATQFNKLPSQNVLQWFLVCCHNGQLTAAGQFRILTRFPF